MEETVVSKEAFLATYKYRVFGERALAKRPNLLPLNVSPLLAGIVADLLTDGHIHARKVGNHIKFGYLAFFSDETQPLIGFNNRLQEQFGIRGKICKVGKRANGQSQGVVACDAVVCRILTLAGATPGNKVKATYEVPKWVRDGDLQIQSEFLRRAFECEGSAFISKKRKRGYITYTMAKLEGYEDNLDAFLNQMREILENSFDVESNDVALQQKLVSPVNGKKTMVKVIRIKRKSFWNFRIHIGFESERKRNKLDEVVACSNGVSEPFK